MSLPSDRTKLQAAIANQVAGNVADASANINALIEAYNTIDQLNQKVDSYISAGALAPIPPDFMSRQAIINGNFDVWQRGTSFTNPSAYTSDRWTTSFVTDGGTLPSTIVHSQQALTPGDIFNSYSYYRVNVNGAGSGFGSNASYTVRQKIENGTRLLCGNGKKITLSFWARSSIANKRLGIYFVQRYGSGGSPSAAEVIAGSTISLTSTWTKYTVTVSTNTLAGKTFGTNNDDVLEVVFIYIWGSGS